MEHWHAHKSRANDNGILSFVLQDRLRVGMFLQLAGCFTPACSVCLYAQVWDMYHHRHLWHGPFVARGPLRLLLVPANLLFLVPVKTCPALLAIQWTCYTLCIAFRHAKNWEVTFVLLKKVLLTGPNAVSAGPCITSG